MEIRFNLTGAERKELVTAVSEIVGCAPVYKKAPTFAYVVHNYTIDKDGTLIWDERVNVEDVRNLMAELAGRGFAPEDSVDLEYPVAEVDDEPIVNASGADVSVGGSSIEDDLIVGASEENLTIVDAPTGVVPVDNSPYAYFVNESKEDAPAEDVPNEAEPGRLVIEVPLEGFTETALSNLEKLVASKAALIMKSIGADNLSIVREGDSLCFPWFTLSVSREEVHAYTQFVHALCEMAKKQRRVVAKEKPADSEKFAFRCFLLRLGFIGEEYSAARKILLANLPGSGSFKNGKRKEQTEDAPVAVIDTDSGAETDGEYGSGEGETESDSAVTGGEEGLNNAMAGF